MESFRVPFPERVPTLLRGGESEPSIHLKLHFDQSYEMGDYSTDIDDEEPLPFVPKIELGRRSWRNEVEPP